MAGKSQNEVGKMVDLKVYCSVFYYLREGYYGTAQRICEQELSIKDNSQELILFRSISLLKLGNHVEVTRSLHFLRQDSVIGFAASVDNYVEVMMIHLDQEEINALDQIINQAWSSASEKACYHAAVTYMLLGNNAKACDLVENHYLNAVATLNDFQFVVLQGFLELYRQENINKAQKLFKKGVSEGYPCAFTGLACVLEKRKNFTDLREVLHNFMIKNPTYLPVYIESCKALLIDRNWELCMEEVQRTLLVQSDCLQIVCLQVIYEVIVKGDIKMVENVLQELTTAITNNEPKSHQIHFKIAQLLIRIAPLDHPVAVFGKNLLDGAISIEQNPEYLGEKVQMLIRAEDFKTAEAITFDALKNNDTIPDAQLLISVTQCFIANNRLEDAIAQMQFVEAAHPEITNASLYMYLMAVLDSKQQKSFQEFFTKVKKAIDMHFSALQSTIFSFDYLTLLNVNFLTEVVLQLYEYAPFTPSNSTSDVLNEIDRILTLVHDCCPALLFTTYLLAKAKYLAMNFGAAEKLLKNCTDSENAPSEAYLLLAQVHIQKNHYDEASRCLDTGLSYNFKVREHPLYHLIRAKLQKKSNQIDASVQTLQKAIKLPSFKAYNRSKRRENLELIDADRIAIYIELMDSYQQLGQLAEAEEVLGGARKEWAGKMEQEELLLMEANLRLQRSDVDGALSVLASISPSQAKYQTARIKMAEIYLHQKKDKQKFAVCFRELAQNNPSPMAYILLGDAYMSIQEPARAIEVFETALKKNPKDDALAEKIGQAYVQCHLYTKAVNYYEAALKSGRRPLMRMRLAELLFELGNYEKCEKVLRQELDVNADTIDVARMKDNVSYWTILSKLHFEKGNWQEATADLVHAREIQMSIISKPSSEIANLDEEKKLAASLCCQLAELYWNRRDADKAIDMYNEAIFLNNTDIKKEYKIQTMTTLANIHLSLGNLDACNVHCQLILNIDQNNADATMMMADSWYQSNETEKATIHFTKFLDKNPNQYHALARCVELSWRGGNIQQAEKYLKNALENKPRAVLDAGFNYCKGLDEWYTGRPNAALHLFSQARRDLEWGERAIYNMIEICLSLINKITVCDMYEYNQQSNALELQYKPGLDYRYQLIENFILLASSSQADVQKALTNFLDMIENENTAMLSVGALLGAAQAYIIFKQVPKAKAQLKRVLNYTWTLQDADYLEKCWLLLAGIYITQGKSDQAIAILRTVLRYNMSSVKAYEYMGFLYERDQKWFEAANNYEESWRIGKQSNPSIGKRLTHVNSGYKLAHSYLKCRKLFDCIEVCHQVLQLYPDCPRIKREILDEARATLRT
ncbi:unnamed protein product [Thelazia callipaeda]|uniref:Tetratricopeptide repeat protein 21B n=1 Tax=Thelazia callipaeda TaxID=103827 RepID=A0A158RAN0_THECL|nr:unnamed protein product [Thelazia callipaeda]